MGRVMCAAILLSGVLAVSGCAGTLNGSGAYEYGGGGGYAAYGGVPAYSYDAGLGGGCGQPVQPYYQPQPYAYSGATEAYAYQEPQPVAPAHPGHAAPPGQWIDRRQQRQQERIHQGEAAGQLTPGEARRLQHEQARIRGAERRMRADGNLSHQERARLNAMQNRSSQDIYRLRHNGVQPGPGMQSQPAGQGRPMVQSRPAPQPRPAAQPRVAARPQAHGGKPAANGGRAPWGR